jgi:uncharacterized membrane protein
MKLDLAVHRAFHPGRISQFEKLLPGDDAIKPYNPKVIQTNLSRDSERELIEALQGQQVGAPSSAQQTS